MKFLRPAFYISTVTVLFCSCLIGGTAQEEFEKGVAHLNANRKSQAFKAFKSAARLAPDSGRYHFAAAQTAPAQNSAFMYTKYAWEKGLRNRAVFAMLLNLSFHTDKEKKLEYALSLFGELPDSLATPLFKAELFLEFGKPDLAYELLNAEFEANRNSDLCPKIANALVQQGKIDQAIDFLRKCDKDRILDADGYASLASLLAMRYEFREVDRLFSELTQSNIYDDRLRLEHATFLVFNARFREAEPLLERPLGPGSAAAKAVLGLRFHSLRLFSALTQGDKSRYYALLEDIPADTIFKESVPRLYEAIKAFSNNEEGAFELLFKARSQLPPDPVTTILCARSALRNKKYKDATALYDRLPGIVLWSPVVVAERAQSIALAGNDDKALQIISYMHEKGIFSRQSLELFRNLALKKDLVEKSEAAQKLLEMKYSGDIGLKWKGLLLAIKNEKTDSALTIARTLSTDYPEEERFELTYLTLLLIKNEFRQVLDELETSKLEPAKSKPIEAAAWKGLGDTSRAIAAYESAVEKRHEPMLVMQLAEMYFQTKDYEKATNLYAKLLEDTSDTMFKDSLQVAVLLNNNAWTIMTAGTKNLSSALSMAKKAYELVPRNLNIIDTYASILLEAKKQKDCIALLESNKEALGQKRLVCHLARAYEEKKDINKAKRYYEDALRLKAEDQKLTQQLSDSEIRERIARLSEEK